jgi:predicted lipid carrier protein YhbT
MAALDDLDLNSLDFGAVEPEEFAKIVKDVPAARIAEFMAGPQRRRVLDEVFQRMGGRFRPDAAAGRRLLVRWRITDGDDLDDVYETEIADRRCTVTDRRTDRTPQLSLTMPAQEFLRLASGNASGPVLFFSRKLKVKGDIRVAGHLLQYFDIPKAG